MLRYSLLFIHVASAMSLFTALGMEAIVLAQLHRMKDGAGTPAALTALGASRRVGGIGSLFLLLSGATLATIYWHWQGAWMGLGLVGLVAIGAVGGATTGRVVKRLQGRLDDGHADTSPADVVPALRQSFVMRAALLTGVVYLMTVKPGPFASAGALAIATVVGLVWGRSGARAAMPRAAEALR